MAILYKGKCTRGRIPLHHAPASRHPHAYKWKRVGWSESIRVARVLVDVLPPSIQLRGILAHAAFLSERRHGVSRPAIARTTNATTHTLTYPTSHQSAPRNRSPSASGSIRWHANYNLQEQENLALNPYPCNGQDEALSIPPPSVRSPSPSAQSAPGQSPEMVGSHLRWWEVSPIQSRHRKSLPEILIITRSGPATLVPTGP